MGVRKLLPVVLACTAVSGSWVGTASSSRPLTKVTAESGVESVPIASLPLELHRRAARFFENMRRSSDSPWFDAHLGDRAALVLRPGVTGIGYYEVPVVGAAGEPRGYLLVTTGDHDFPVAGAMKGGETASARLARMAAAKGERVARVYMPSLFTFVAENDRGEVVARIGGLPGKPEGIDRTTLSLPEEARRVRTVFSDGEARLETPAPIRSVRVGSWSSWDEYKAARDDASALDLEIMRRNAVPFWEEEAALTANAEGLDPDRAHRVAILARGDATFSVSGPGAALVEATRVEGPAGDAWVRLRVLEEPADATAELALELRYASGERETLGFAIAPRVRAMPRVFAQAFPTCQNVAIRSRKGHYLVATNGGRNALDARSDSVGPWETFRVERQSDGKIALRSGEGGFYVRRTAGRMDVRGDGLSNEAKLTPVPSEGGTWAFRLDNGLFMGAFAGGNGPIMATASSAGPDERFTVLCDPPRPASTFPWASGEADAWAKQRKYKQVDGNTGPNKSGCVSGCGATAWAMLVGWVDYAAANGHPKFNAFDRIYLQDGGRGRTARDEVAPEFQHRGIENITVEIRDAMNDWGVSGCTITGSRFTAPHIMAQANRYFWGRVPARVIADYDGAGIGTPAGAANVVNSIRAGNVTAIGTGHLSHYPVAFGMHVFTPKIWDTKLRRWIDRQPNANTVLEVNWGWGDGSSGSVPLHSWFKGIIDVTPYSRVDQIANDCTLRAQSGGIAANTRMDRDYFCRTHLRSDERHVAFEVAEKLLNRDVMAQARSRRLKACLLDATDIQCAPCSTTDRLIARMTFVPADRACPANTVNAIP